MNDFEKDGQEVRKEFGWSETLPRIAIIRSVAALEDVDQTEVAKVCDTRLFNSLAL